MEGWKRIRWVLIYGVFYLLAFYIIEKRTVNLNIIHTKFDNYIPFCEYFIIPYFLWFFFVAAVIFYFAFINKNSQEYYRLIINLGIGMTLFIMISWIYPNGHDLRPDITGNNIFERAVRLLYRIDTPTNIFPSIHVFNSIACCTAVVRNPGCRRYKALTVGVVLLTLLIIISTVMLKQHSVVDIVGAVIMSCLFYPVVYSGMGRVPEGGRRQMGRKHIGFL